MPDVAHMSFFAFHLFLGFCLLVAFVLLENGLLTSTLPSVISRKRIPFWPPFVSCVFLFSFDIIFKGVEFDPL